MNPSAFFLETTSRADYCDKIDDIVQYLTLNIEGHGCDDRWDNPGKFAYVVDIEKVGIRVTGVLRPFDGQISREDDGEWKDRETNEQYAETRRTERHCEEADFPLRNTGDYWVRGWPGATLLHDVALSFDFTIANRDMYFGRSAQALIAFIPIAKVEIIHKCEAAKPMITVITGAPSVCRIGAGSSAGWGDCDRNQKHIYDFLSQGKLIRIEGLYADYPDWVLKGGIKI